MTGLRRVRSRVALRADQISQYLGSVFVAVLLVPVLPDIAVELCGADNPAWRNPVLRLVAVLLVVLACIATYFAHRRRDLRRARRAAIDLAGLGTCDVLVLAVSFRSRYALPGSRESRLEIPEILIDQLNPATVIAVATPQTREHAEMLRPALEARGTNLVIVEIRDAYDPAIVLADIPRLVLDQLDTLKLTKHAIRVDLTAATAIITLGMLRLATILSTRCTYISARYDRGSIVSGTQRGYTLEPSTVMP